MKYIAFLLCFAVLMSVLCVPALADSATTDFDFGGSSSEFTTWQIAIIATLMFVAIAVVGVMFLKIVMQNNKRR